MWPQILETAEHRIGVRVAALADQASRHGDMWRTAPVELPDGRQCVVKVSRATAPRKPDPGAP